MTAGFARWACGGVIALALPTLALAQGSAPISLGGGGPDVSAIDPATVRDLPSARDYRPPPGIAFKAADFISASKPGQCFINGDDVSRTRRIN